MLPILQPQVPTISTWTNSGNSSPATVARALIWEFLLSGTRRERVLPSLASLVLSKEGLAISQASTPGDNMVRQPDCSTKKASWNLRKYSYLPVTVFVYQLTLRTHQEQLSGNYEIWTHSRRGSFHTSLTITLQRELQLHEGRTDA